LWPGVGRVGSNKYLLDQIRGKFSFTHLSGNAHHDSALAGGDAKIVEDKANGPAIIDTLRNELSGIVPLSPQAVKLARAQAAAPELSRNYWLPQTLWAEEFMKDVRLPNATHDTWSMRGVRLLGRFDLFIRNLRVYCGEAR